MRSMEKEQDGFIPQLWCNNERIFKSDKSGDEEE